MRALDRIGRSSASDPKKVFAATAVVIVIAAHRLTQHPGACRNLHGHRWKLEVRITGRIDPDDGMVKSLGEGTPHRSAEGKGPGRRI
ncbi:MAG: hypothetical protein MAG715_00364 [Methanonatronarchaeales archaeon]|nr:hypothetical protein [Methanonatronarchaeales archaeon]